MKVYTKTGDKGTTSTYDGKRLQKNHVIFETVGEIDELTSRIGISCSLASHNYLIQEKLRRIQSVLQNINSHVATIQKEKKKNIPEIQITLVTDLENQIDNMEKFNDKLTAFILPGVTQLDASLHSCRTQVRKCERMLLKIKNEGVDECEDFSLGENIFKYMNRLSDYFFVMARYVCKKQDETDCFQSEFS